ncbi:hypothetical protein [Streptomyces sp. NPDC004546]|uniref:hypothetical protein n=1 Tax=Streptomyces sp. NPDC004546 TaxID=3154282 RepID=UPI0033A69A4F
MPQLQDCCAGFGGAGLGIRSVGLAGPVSGIEEPGSVVGEPADQGVVRPGGVEFDENALAQGRDGVIWQ